MRVEPRSALAGALTLAGAALLFAAGAAPPGPNFTLYLAAMAIGFAGMAMARFQAPKLSAESVLAFALLAQCVLLANKPIFEDDFFRYLWDGYRLAHGASPYGVPPEAFFGDPHVPTFMRPILSGVNNPEAPTIYGPTLQGLFALGHRLAPGEERALRVFFILGNLGLIALLLRRFSPQIAALYALNPLALTEIALNGHPDGLIALFFMLALALAGPAGPPKRPFLVGLCFAAAAGVKISALAAFPLLLFLPMRAWAGAILGLIALYGPFVIATPAVGLDGAAIFAQKWAFNPFLFAPAQAVFGDRAGRALCALAGIGLILALIARSKGPSAGVLAAIFGLVLAFSPAVNAWYLLWVLPFAVGTNAVSPWIASAALGLSYASGLNLARQDLAAFQLVPAAQAVEWALVLPAFAFDFWRLSLRPGARAFKKTP